MNRSNDTCFRRTVGMLLILVAAICAARAPAHQQGGEPPPSAIPGGEAGRGPAAIMEYGCFSCHEIPGVRRASGRVGPKLQDIREQIYIGGVLANTPANMIEWLRDPPRFSPETAMPNLEVTEQKARDIAAYLYTDS